MINKTVYLAGPTTGLTFDQSTDWRDEVRNQLLEIGIKALSPLRAKDYLIGRGQLKDHYGEVLSTPRGITTRDRFDATHCSVLFVNLLGATRVSIGTVMEIAWADDNRIPIVVAMEPAGNLHDHSMINECIGYKVSTIQEGIDVVKAILGDY